MGARYRSLPRCVKGRPSTAHLAGTAAVRQPCAAGYAVCWCWSGSSLWNSSTDTLNTVRHAVHLNCLRSGSRTGSRSSTIDSRTVVEGLVTRAGGSFPFRRKAGHIGSRPVGWSSAHAAGLARHRPSGRRGQEANSIRSLPRWTWRTSPALRGRMVRRMGSRIQIGPRKVEQLFVEMTIGAANE